MDEVKYLYRYNRGYIDCNLQAHIYLDKFPIVRETKKGVYLGISEYTEKWVSVTGKKRYAYPTPEEAMVNFQKRTKSCIKHLERQLENSRAFLAAQIREINTLKSVA